MATCVLHRCILPFSLHYRAREYGVEPLRTLFSRSISYLATITILISTSNLAPRSINFHWPPPPLSYIYPHIMDSMRSLNTSLPRSTTHRGQQQLLQALRTAALSVTNLYKTAASEQESLRQSGYQDALDDLLAFLDRENLGLGDGEGWKVRRWATERLDGSDRGAAVSESEDDRGDVEKNARNSSPVLQRRTTEDLVGRQPSRSSSPVRTESVPTPTMPHALPVEQLPPTPPAFTFSSTRTLPQHHEVEMQSAENPVSVNSEQSEATIPVRVEISPRGSRTPHRHGSVSRHGTRNSTRDLGAGGGSKRKLPIENVWDIPNPGNGKDGFGGGGKRGRFA